jgi:hypothetical protein
MELHLAFFHADLRENEISRVACIFQRSIENWCNVPKIALRTHGKKHNYATGAQKIFRCRLSIAARFNSRVVQK